MNANVDVNPTRRTLLSRLRDLDNQGSWKEFFDTYWRLIYVTAIKSGLSDAEAEDVVQETVISVVRKIPGFRYDPEVGSFKAWLLKLTRWRIIDQLRTRQKALVSSMPGQTDLVERVPDQAVQSAEDNWDEEWRKNTLQVALHRVRDQVDPRHYQVFDLYAVQNWPALRVAKALHLSVAQVYLIKHRVCRLIKREVSSLNRTA